MNSLNDLLNLIDTNGVLHLYPDGSGCIEVQTDWEFSYPHIFMDIEELSEIIEVVNS